MEEKTAAGYAGLFQALFVPKKKYRDFLLKRNYLADHVFFLKRSKKKRDRILSSGHTGRHTQSSG
jgi:hypothetical protein